MENNEIYDVTIIGGGPVGIFTAFYAGMRGMSVKIIDALPQLGGQLSALYPEKYIYDIAALPKVKAQQLVDQLISQMSLFDVSIQLDESVDKITQSEDIFTLTTNKQSHYSKTIIITAGNGAFQPRKMNIEKEDCFSNIHYFIQNLEQFRGKEVAILGGGDSAVDWALMLENVAKSVTLTHRRDQFRAHEHSIEQLNQSKVEVLTPFIPHELKGDSTVSTLVLKHTKADNELVDIQVDDVIVNYGFVSSLGSISSWGLEIVKNSIVVNSRMETNIPGIYAAGDICTYDGKVKLIASGFGEAPVAVSSAKIYINPEASRQPLHSTSLLSGKL